MWETLRYLITLPVILAVLIAVIFPFILMELIAPRTAERFRDWLIDTLLSLQGG